MEEDKACGVISQLYRPDYRNKDQAFYLVGSGENAEKFPARYQGGSVGRTSESQPGWTGRQVTG
jgi:hypothetical protein